MRKDQAEKLWDNAFGWHFVGSTSDESVEAENNPLFRRAALMFFADEATFLQRKGGREASVAFLREWADAMEDKKP